MRAGAARPARPSKSRAPGGKTAIRLPDHRCPAAQYLSSVNGSVGKDRKFRYCKAALIQLKIADVAITETDQPDAAGTAMSTSTNANVAKPAPKIDAMATRRNTDFELKAEGIVLT